MCGRYALHGTKSRASDEPLAFYDEAIDFAPHYNLAPTQALPVYCIDADHRRRLTLMRWGLVPAWATGPAPGAPMHNARAETAAQKPAFRSAFRQRRCLVPMNGFYEWQRSGPQKTPYYLQMCDQTLFAAAGLYECRPGNAGEPPLLSFAMLTTTANELMQPIHDRMPVIIAADDYETWLDPHNNGRALDSLMRPFAAQAMRAHAVSPRVNSVRNDDAALLAEVAPSSAILAPTPFQGQLL